VKPWVWILIVAGAAIAFGIYYENSSGGDDTGDDTGDGTSVDTTGLANVIANGVQTAEGFFTPGTTAGGVTYTNGSLSYQNNNPGNIEGSGDAGSSGPYAVFSSYGAGFSALVSTVTDDFLQNDSWTLQQASNYYVNGNPSSTAQNSVNYAGVLAQAISSAIGLSVTPSTTIGAIKSAAGAAS
jgi:hypothetical protein